jgi:hypothetical protein
MKEQKKIKELYNLVIEKECNKEFRNILKNIDIIVSRGKIISLGTGSNPIYELFHHIAPYRINDDSIFYHFFKKPEYILKENGTEQKNDLLTDKIIQMTSLTCLSEEDAVEYSHFLKRIDSKYFKTEDFNEDKRNQYVFCLTRNWRKEEEKFWEQYGGQHKGVCVGFKFLKNEGSPQFKKNGLNGIAFRDVYYDSDNGYNYNLKFINILNKELLKKFGKELFLYGAIEFAKFYKRESCEWENETRLLINTTKIRNKGVSLFANNLNEIGEEKIEKKDGKERYYFKLKTNNCLFSLEIVEIIIGKKAVMNKEHIEKICSDQAIKLCFDY